MTKKAKKQEHLINQLAEISGAEIVLHNQIKIASLRLQELDINRTKILGELWQLYEEAEA